MIFILAMIFGLQELFYMNYFMKKNPGMFTIKYIFFSFEINNLFIF